MIVGTTILHYTHYTMAMKLIVNLDVFILYILHYLSIPTQGSIIWTHTGSCIRDFIYIFYIL